MPPLPRNVKGGVRWAILAFAGSAECGLHHRQEAVAARRNSPHTVHQAMKEPLVLVVIAVADAHPSGRPPDLGRHEQEPRPRRRQCRVSHRSDFGAFLAIQQLQPAVQVVGQHRDLKPVAVHHPAPGGKGRQPPLRANIDETVLPVIITEQGENRNQGEAQRNILGFSHGFACR